MGQTCCFDTDMISYLLIPNSKDPNWPERHKVVRILFDDLRSKKVDFYLPSLVVFELLMTYEEPDKRRELHHLLTETFKIASFDISSAEVGAELLSKIGYQKKHPDIAGETRKLYKTDAKILAIAISINAEILYTNNPKDFSKIADGRLRILGIQDLPIQDELFSSYTDS